jgi:hypothetical protein
MSVVADHPARPEPMMETTYEVHSDGLCERGRLAQTVKGRTRTLAGSVSGVRSGHEQAGVLKGGNGLQPTSTATTVRVADGKTQVLDGPYADSKEQFAGFHIIDVPDIDAAISWAARCPTSLHGVVEVRPIMDVSLADLLEGIRNGNTPPG